jgi:hypothetical protein
MTDLLVRLGGGEPFTWGRANLTTSTSSARRAYIDALKSANGGDYRPLQSFVRS